MTTEIALKPADGTSSLMAIIARAANDPQMDVSKLQALLAVKKEWEADEARKAFVAAMAEFKKNAPTITKNKHVRHNDFWHATLDHVCERVVGALGEYGLAHRWEVEQKGDAIKVTCILTHVAGHSERVSLESAADTSGSKNKVQAVGSTVTYLQRYTLLSATGLAAGGTDNDGRGDDTPAAEPADPWTDELRDAAADAAGDGKYAEWWKQQSAQFRNAAVRTQQHADFKAVEPA